MEKLIKETTFKRLLETFFNLKIKYIYTETKDLLKLKYGNITYIALKGGNND